jgi:hypothetical protein
MKNLFIYIGIEIHIGIEVYIYLIDIFAILIKNRIYSLISLYARAFFILEDRISKSLFSESFKISRIRFFLFFGVSLTNLIAIALNFQFYQALHRAIYILETAYISYPN